jgi:hypothetical protein
MMSHITSLLRAPWPALRVEIGSKVLYRVSLEDIGEDFVGSLVNN